MAVMDDWELATGKDFMGCATRALNGYYESSEVDSLIARAEILTSVVSRADAAHLIYLAAKVNNSQVEFGEIQEAIIDDMDISNDAKFYPVVFVALVNYMLVGSSKKK